MSYHDALAALVGRYLALAPEGDIEFVDIVEEPIDTEALAELWLLFDDFKTATNAVEKILNTELAERMEAQGGGVYDVGDWQVFRGYRSKSEKCDDHEMFFDWLEDAGMDMVRKLVNPNSIRVGSLPPDVRERLYTKTVPPKAEKQAVAVPKQVLEDNRTRRELRAS